MSSNKEKTQPIFIDANNMKLISEVASLIAAGVVRPVRGLTLSEANQGESYARLRMAQSADEEPAPEVPPPSEIRRTDMRAVGTWASAMPQATDTG